MRAAEAWKHGRPYTFSGDPAIVAAAQKGFGAFVEWATTTRLKIEEPEVSLVRNATSTAARSTARWSGIAAPWPTTRRHAATYPEHLLQVVSYGKLWEEHHPDRPIDGGFYILRFSRDHGDFHVDWFAELNDAWEAFLLCRQLYDLRAKVKARC